MLHNDFRRFLEILETLNPAQIEDAQTRIRNLRQKNEVISEFEARTNQECECPFCGGEKRQKWGRTRTKVQRYRCCDCKKTYTGRTTSTIGRIHRPDLFMTVLHDMLNAPRPQSVRKLAAQLGVNKYTIWRWRMQVLSIVDNSSVVRFSGIVEADETYQRESRKGSREWVRHLADPANVAPPPRPRWEDFTTKGLKMMRGLSRWQLPILTVADRSGVRLFQRLPDRKSATLEKAMMPLIPGDAVLCSDGASAYKKVADQSGIEHFVVGSKPGARIAGGCYHIQNVNSLHARYSAFIRPFCGPAAKYLNGYIRWLEARLARMKPSDVIRLS
ncbi:MAG: IS1595 family transposase [Cognatishimia sp.]|uniref:IS1595 family transposase n=1 Tax=Cognatishimia sp. TaxID=2211648 RepID=UPI004057F6C8